MPLTALQVKNPKLAPGRYADGKGLYLFVKPSGSRSWVLRVQSAGRRRDFGLGPADLVTLTEARDKAIEGRRMVRAGKDPSIEWAASGRVAPTFEEAARQYHEVIKAGFRNDRHSASWLSSLEAYAFKQIGAKSVAQIDTQAIQSCLLPIWMIVPETARRVRQRIGAVLDYSHAQGWRATEAPMRAVSKGLPKQPQRDSHYAAMPYSQVPSFIQLLGNESDTAGRLAVRFTVLTAARSGETRGATWEEINRDENVWNIPGSRMKAGKPHSVPLSAAAMEVLDIVAALNGGERRGLIFKGTGGKSLSDMTLTKVLRSAGVREYTVHGFRSSFRDWVAERTSFPGEWAEAALAHILSNKVEAAYRRTKFLDQRRKLMAAWADHVAGASEESST